MNFKIYDVTNWITIIIHILSDTSRSKGNQTMKFDQLTDYNMRNIFLEKSCTKCGRETSLKPFFEKSKLGKEQIRTQSAFKMKSKALFIIFRAFIEANKTNFCGR